MTVNAMPIRYTVHANHVPLPELNALRPLSIHIQRLGLSREAQNDAFPGDALLRIDRHALSERQSLPRPTRLEYVPQEREGRVGLLRPSAGRLRFRSGRGSLEEAGGFLERDGEPVHNLRGRFGDVHRLRGILVVVIGTFRG